MNHDAANLPELTKRQEEILSYIVRAYTHQPEAVSSKSLVESFELGVSAATVRNEMSVLEDLGYIAAPHKSAGRIPTENGYRYVVARMMDESNLTKTEQTHITNRLSELPMTTEHWLRVVAQVLSRTTQIASLVTTPISETSRFKHLELVAIQGRLVLMVLVLHGGTVHQRMLNLAEPVPQSKLGEVATRINNLFIDLHANDMRLKVLQLPLLEREVAEIAIEVMIRADNNQVRTVYRDGLGDIISSFQDGEGAQQAVRVFEERVLLDMVLSEILDPLLDDVRVIVAGDGRFEELSQLSMVVSRYGVPGQVTGAVGVLGPTHINYGRAISSVRYVSSVMTNMMVKLYTEEAAPDDTLDEF